MAVETVCGILYNKMKYDYFSTNKGESIMKKRIYALLMAAVMMVGISACGGSAEGPQAVENPSVVTLAAGDPAASYFAFSNLLAGYMGDAADVTVSVTATGGAVANVEGVADGLYTMGMAQADTMDYAWKGINSFEGKGEKQSFRALGGLYEESVQIVTLDESIETVADLKGHVVSVGAEGSGIYYNAMDILTAYGMTAEDIDMEFLGFGEAAEAMKNGDVDAAFMVSGAPTKAIEDLAAEYDLHLVSVDGAEAEKLIADHPYYNKHVVMSGTYTGLDKDVTTISVKATMIVSADASKELVYNLTAGIYENTESVSAILTRGIDMNVENATTGITVPFHAGAAKYFAEKGITVPTE